ncbi:MAG: hypothetical protein OTI34_05705 [Lewinella sp.]|nr:hypothetical protein [Lewinella sp.]
MILTRQFRLPNYANGDEDGMLIKACAGIAGSKKTERIHQEGMH